jgi:uracil-DNA glycosylase family protein
MQATLCVAPHAAPNRTARSEPRAAAACRKGRRVRSAELTEGERDSEFNRQGRGGSSGEVRPDENRELVRDGRLGLPQVRELATACRACDLWAHATQTVFGEGPVPARWMLVGEQPGDREDLAGQPFVGPAGRLLDDALGQAGIDRERTFVTNVVKHFKWRPDPRTKRRLHESPSRAEVGACLPWVQSELALVQPEALVLLGASAAQAFVGQSFRITRDHGRQPGSDLAPTVVATFHPSAILRARGHDAREAAMRMLVEDLRLAAH